VPDLELVPVDQETAFAFIRQHHRHHLPPPGDILRVGVALEGRLVGVATWGRPVARSLNDGFTAELTRLATDGTPNAASKLYGAVARMAFAAGYRRVVTYVLASETGISAKAAGWRLVAEVRGRSWSCPSRPRLDKHPLQAKLRFEVMSPTVQP
jgi:hypothetical protein